MWHSIFGHGLRFALHSLDMDCFCGLQGLFPGQDSGRAHRLSV